MESPHPFQVNPDGKQKCSPLFFVNIFPVSFSSKWRMIVILGRAKVSSISIIDNHYFCRTQKKEHVDERLMSAYDLMNEMVTEQAPKNPALIIQNSVRSSHTNAGKKTSRVKANNRYKDKKIVNRRKKPTEKTRLKSVTELHGTRIIRDQPGLRDFSSLVRADHGRNSTSTARVYDYDIEESARQFITRKSYENYKQKKSTSLDFDRSVSLRIESSFQLDPWVDQMIEDVSPSNSLDLQRLGHLDTLLSGDSELRDLLSDVIPVKPRFLETKDNFMSDTKSRTPEIGWRVTSQGESNGNTVKDFKMDEQENRIVKNSFQQHPDHILSSTYIVILTYKPLRVSCCV